MMNLTEDIHFVYTSCIKTGICERKVCVWLTFLWRNMDPVCSDQSYLCLDHKEIPIDDALMVNYAVSIILVLVFMGISIPVQLKYGNEKGRLAVIAIGVGGFAVIVGGIQLGKVFDIEMTAALQRVEKMGAGTVSVIGCIVSVILIVISYKISVRIMEKKEF